ncbi:hypothetical protein H0H92_007119, partial [Tricholoma furcatifolium]
MESAICALNLSNSDGRVTKRTQIPDRQSTAEPFNVNWEDQGRLLVPHSKITQVEKDLQDAKGLSPALETQRILALQQHIKESGVLPARYVIKDVKMS